MTIASTVNRVDAVPHSSDALAEAGKRRRLSRLADKDGRFAMIAVDQRTSLKKVLSDRFGGDEVRGALRLIKKLVAETIAPLGSAVLTDPIYGYPHSVGVIPPGIGLILAVEVSGYETVHGSERRSRLLDNFNVFAAAASGADAAKLLIFHHPDVSEETQRHQQDIVRRVGVACREVGLPFVLEIVTYALVEDAASPAAIRQKPDAVLDGVQIYSADEFGVDLLKVQFPADLKYAEECLDRPYSTGTVLFERGEVASICRRVDEAAKTPWVILSAGVDSDEFIDNVRMANAAGASGFLCGRAVWKEVVQHVPDEEAMERFVRSKAVANFRRIRDANTEARAWFDHPRWRAI